VVDVQRLGLFLDLAEAQQPVASPAQDDCDRLHVLVVVGPEAFDCLEGEVREPHRAHV